MPDPSPARATRPLCPSPELAIIIPTFNEAGNVAEIARRIGICLAGIDWEIIFVDDDSADGTPERVRELSRADGRIRLLRRVGRRGLSSACIEGMLATTAPFLAVIDADLQHDETLLPQMLARLRAEDLDIVAACLQRQRDRADLRFIGLIGSRTKWASFRHRLSERGFTEAVLDRVTCPIGLPGITDKAPEVIAASVVAQLLLFDAQHVPAA